MEEKQKCFAARKAAANRGIGRFAKAAIGQRLLMASHAHRSTGHKFRRQNRRLASLGAQLQNYARGPSQQRRGRNPPGQSHYAVIVGNRVEGAAAQDERDF